MDKLTTEPLPLQARRDLDPTASQQPTGYIVRLNFLL